MKLEVQRWQNSPDMTSPLMAPRVDGADLNAVLDDTSRGTPGGSHIRSTSVDKIPLLSETVAATGIDGGAKDVAKPRKIGELPP
jgi:hypothetical protein